MKKSPLSQFQESPNKFNRNYRGRRQGKSHSYYNDQKDDDNSFQNYQTPLRGSSTGVQHFQQVHPLNTSTPTYQHNHGNRGYWQNKQKYVGEAKNHQGNFQGSHYSPSIRFNQQDASFQNAQNNDVRVYREMDVSGMFNILEVLRNPWEQLERELSQTRGNDAQKIQNSEGDSYEKVTLDSLDSKKEISNDNSISSNSTEKNMESNNSSVDLKIDSITFGSKSLETSAQSDDNLLKQANN